MNTPSFCTHCGKPLRGQEKFCMSCGAPTQAASPSPAEPALGAAVPPEDAAFATETTLPEDFMPPQETAPLQDFTQPEAPATPDEAISTPYPEAAVGDTQPLYTPSYAAEDAQAFTEPPYAAEDAQPYAAPSYTAPAVQELPRIPRAERKKVSAPRVVGSAALCLLAILFGLASSMIFMLRSATSPDAIESVLEDVRISDLTVPADDGSTQPLSEYIAEKIPADIRAKYQLNAGSIERLMERSFARDYLESKLEQVADALYSGNGDSLLSAYEVKRFLRLNAEEIYMVTGYRLTEKNLNEIGSYLENNRILNGVSLDGMSMESLQEQIPLLSVIPVLTSYVTACVLAVLAVGMLVLAAWISKFRRFSLIYVSVTCFCVGAAQLSVAWLTGVLAAAMHDLFPLPESFYTHLLSPLRNAGHLIGLPLVGVGLVCIAAVIVSRVICKSRNKQKNAVLTDPVSPTYM